MLLVSDEHLAEQIPAIAERDEVIDRVTHGIASAEHHSEITHHLFLEMAIAFGGVVNKEELAELGEAYRDALLNHIMLQNSMAFMHLALEEPERCREVLKKWDTTTARGLSFTWRTHQEDYYHFLEHLEMDPSTFNTKFEVLQTLNAAKEAMDNGH